jgi:tungstate transport system permease protein
MPDTITEAIRQAINLIISGNHEVFQTVSRSLYVSGLGTLLSCLWSIPIAIILGLYSFKGKWLIRSTFNALLGVPTVALGLLLVLFLSRRGPAGFLQMLYTVNGMILGQAILVSPIIISYAGGALNASDIQVRDLARTLGASTLRTHLVVIRETMWALVLALIAAFNRGFGELGIAMLVGGNIAGFTRVLTTAIALESNMGDYALAVAYAIILMIIVFAITLAVNLVERLRQ